MSLDESTLTPGAVEEAMRCAEANGFEVVRSSPTALLLDLDTLDQLAQYEAVKLALLRNVQVDGIDHWRSKSGNKHVHIRLVEPIEDPAKRYALQAALGSDPVKEMLSIFRLLNGVREPSMLFKPKQEELCL